jgi:hypothetical protein
MHGQLAREFAETAYRLHRAAGTDEVVEILLLLAARAVHSDHAGLMLASGSARRRPTSLEPAGATDPVASEAERLELELREGPCLTPGGPIRVDDVATDERWPRWGSQVSKLGVRSVLTCRLDPVGVLCWYDDTPGRFTDESVAIARVLAAHATPALTAPAAALTDRPAAGPAAAPAAAPVAAPAVRPELAPAVARARV